MPDGSVRSGKTSLMKAVNGLWPHGRATSCCPEGVRTFYATQDVKLPRLSLKRLVCLPDTDDVTRTCASPARCTRRVSASSSNSSVDAS